MARSEQRCWQTTGQWMEVVRSRWWIGRVPALGGEGRRSGRNGLTAVLAAPASSQPSQPSQPPSKLTPLRATLTGSPSAVRRPRRGKQGQCRWPRGQRPLPPRRSDRAGRPRDARMRARAKPRRSGARCACIRVALRRSSARIVGAYATHGMNPRVDPSVPLLSEMVTARSVRSLASYVAPVS